MENLGKKYISLKYTKQDFRKLNLSLSSPLDVWEKAISIFDDRIRGRYFRQIEILSHDANGNGFAIMALNCLLVETLMQFLYGYSETPWGENLDKYTDFLRREFPAIFNTKMKAIRFYKGIRCGILHSAQTQKRTLLTTNEAYVVELDKGELYISVSRFSDELRNWYNGYIGKLKNPSETQLREMFIQKMGFICQNDSYQV